DNSFETAAPPATRLPLRPPALRRIHQLRPHDAAPGLPAPPPLILPDAESHHHHPGISHVLHRLPTHQPSSLPQPWGNGPWQDSARHLPAPALSSRANQQKQISSISTLLSKQWNIQTPLLPPGPRTKQAWAVALPTHGPSKSPLFRGR
ncbi:hypothetical protein M9458_028444, partial [Cirrhinus mrigala]